jgi:DNA-directed RNA polymerase subunit K/omega
MSEIKTAETGAPSVHSLENRLLDVSAEKYRMVGLAIRWAHEVKRREQDPGPLQNFVDKALEEILGGKVSMDEIEKLPPPPKPEKKPLATEILKPVAEEKADGKEEKKGD